MAGYLPPLSPIPDHARLIWLKFIRAQNVSRNGQDRFFYPWARSAVTSGDLLKRGQAMGSPEIVEMRAQGCPLREHRFETQTPSVLVDSAHDVVVLDNYHMMCLETFYRQPKDAAAEGFGHITDFDRFLIPVDQMLEVSRDPQLDHSIYRPFWGPLGEQRAPLRPAPTVLLLVDDWNPAWVRNRHKAEWASDLLVVRGTWELSLVFQHKAREIEPLLRLVEGRLKFEYCHWRTLHN